LRCEDYPGYSKWPQYYHMDLYKWEREARRISQRRDCDDLSRGRSNEITGLKMEVGCEPNNASNLQELENTRKWILSYSLQKEHSPADTLNLVKWEPFWILSSRGVRFVAI
jgi:hypothetical protein